MAKTKISEFSTTAGNNTDINSINIAEGCSPSGINDAIRELMRQLKEFQTGGAGDSVNSGGDFSVATNKFTVASASGNTSVAGTLGVTGTTTLTGALVANGNATLGDASGDTVTIKGTPTLEVNPTLSGGTANGVLYLNGSKVATSGSALVFDGTNLGLGVTPSAWGSNWRAINFGYSSGIGQLAATSAGSGEVALVSSAYNNNTNWLYFYTGVAASKYSQVSGQHQWYTAASGTAGDAITFTQAMSLLSTGELVIGKTSTSTSTAGLSLQNYASVAGSVVCVKTGSGQYTAWGNYYSGTYVGGMEYTNTATIFAVSSDLRLKKDIVDSPSASTKIDQIRVVSHGWKHDDETIEFGVIAQELYDVMPQSVIKGDDGDEVIGKTWGVDYSKLVPLLIKEVQSLRQRVAALEA